MKLGTAQLGILLISTVMYREAIGESATRILQPRTYNPSQVQTRTVPVQQATTIQRGGVVRQQQQVQGRRVAAVSDKSYAKVRTRRGSNVMDPDRPTDIRLFLSGGLSNLASADGGVQDFREQQKIGGNYLVGLGADVRLQRYFGFELDAYYGIAPTQTIVFDDEDTQKKKIQHMGGLFNLKGQLPTYLGSMRVVPKLGAGYGLMKLKQTTEAPILSDTIEADETVKGIYGTVGFDIEPASWMIISTDYAKSVSGSGSFNIKSATASGDSALNDAQFDRIRFGVLFRVHPNAWLGGNYIRRSMKFAADESGASATSDVTSLLDLSNAETISQIAATILFQF